MRCSCIAIGSAACCLLLLQVSLVLHWSIHDSVMLRAQSSRKAMSGPFKSSSPDHDSEYVLETQYSTNGSVLDGPVRAQQTDSLHSCIRTNASLTGVVAAVVVITHKRVEYLNMCLESVLEVHARQLDNRQKFPLFISQDGTNRAVAQLASSFAPTITHMQHIEPDNFPTRKPSEPLAYYRIASHYKFVLQQMFDCLGYPKLIMLEDDMRLAVDFFSYFEAGAKLLDADPGLYCVSSWNDHGQKQFVQDAARLERSDFFPGLGWMLTNSLWQSFKEDWPAAYWDDWMRLSAVRKGRHSIRPEVCRTYNFGEKGSSHGQYYRKYLQPIRLNDEDIDWSFANLQYLELAAYESQLVSAVAEAKQVAGAEDIQQHHGPVKLVYESHAEYTALAEQIGMITDWKDGIPRASYHGIVHVNIAGVRCMLVPMSNMLIHNQA